MNNDLISRSELKKALQEYKQTQYNDDRPDLEYEYIDIDDLNYVINNAPTVDEIPQGDWVRKEDIIRYIATQYSEHNELVPIWLSIGDMKGGEK